MNTNRNAAAVAVPSSSDWFESVAEKTWDKHYRSAAWRGLLATYRAEMLTYVRAGYATAKQGSFRTPNPHGTRNMAAILWDAGYVAFSNVPDEPRGK